MTQLVVYAGTQRVGYLAEGAGGQLTFSYTNRWLEDSKAIPLSPELPLSKQVFSGMAVLSYFENLLPEGDIRAFIAKAAHISPDNVFGLLARFGGDTAGLVSLLPEDEEPTNKAHYLPVTAAEIKQWFTQSRGIPLSIRGEQARMSLSGAQDKMTVYIDAAGNLSIPLGIAPSSHIIKPSITHRAGVPNTAINEVMVMTLAKAVGLEVAAVSFDPALDAAIIARYDRKMGQDGQLQRLHQNDLCQLIGLASDKKYESEGGPSLQHCFDTVTATSSQPAVDKRRLIEWVIFNLITGNRDSHAKNLSMITIGQQIKLAPFYDLLCTSVYSSLSQKFAFKIGGENRPRWIMSRHWERFAVETGTKPAWVGKTRAEMIKKIEQALPTVARQLGSVTETPDNQLMIQKVEDSIRQAIKTMTVNG